MKTPKKSTTVKSTPKKISVRSVLIMIGILGIVMMAVAASIYFYIEYRRADALLKDPTKAQKHETEALVAAIGKLMMLPTDEEPTVAIVSDREKVQNQQFFRNAANGDQVLMYTKAQKAILYRPSTHMIIEVAPLNIEPASVSAERLVSRLTRPFRVSLINGTDVKGLAKTFETRLLEKVPAAIVVEKENAKALYKKTVVIDLTGSYATEAGVLSQLFQAEVGLLPSYEAVPQIPVDIIVLLGADLQE